MKPNIIYLCLLAALLVGCKTQKAYHFFVAGHTYGSPSRKAPGLHPPFVADFEFLQTDSLLRFGVLTGDIVYHSRDSFWDAVDAQLSTFTVPVHFATGNHDEGHKPIYSNRYGTTYYQFTQGGDLCIVLNPGLGGWNIWNEQLDFLKASLLKAEDYQHVFVFFHHLLWWTSDNDYSDVKPNSLDGRSPEINFWDTVVPLLEATALPVYCFAGDIGANRQTAAIYGDQYNNIRFIASGMGSITGDNYLLVEVDDKGEVTVNVRWLRPKQLNRLDIPLRY